MKNIIIAAMSIVLSNAVLATEQREGAAVARQTQTVDPTIQAEKDAWGDTIKVAVQNNDFPTFTAAISDGKKKSWFSPKAIDWARRVADQFTRTDMVLYLSTFEGTAQPSHDHLVEVLRQCKTDEFALYILDCLLQQGAQQEVLVSALERIERPLSKAAGRGLLDLVQRLVNPPQGPSQSNDAVLKSIKSAAYSGKLEAFNWLVAHARGGGFLTQDTLNMSIQFAADQHSMRKNISSFTEEDLKGNRDVVNVLLNMDGNGPNQESVNLAFLNACGRDDELLMKIMLLGDTPALRKGLRPTNKCIVDGKGRCFEADNIQFLEKVLK